MSGDLDLWMVHEQAEARLCELTDRIGIDDLTTLEVLAFVAVLESADKR
jgi:hypothetical protein